MVELRRSTRLRTINYADSSVREEIESSKEKDYAVVPELISEQPSNSQGRVSKRTQPAKDHSKRSLSLRIQRPGFSSQDIDDRREIVDVNFSEMLQRLIEEQSKHFYDNLRKPEYVEHGDLRVFKHPEDKMNLLHIYKQLKEVTPALRMDFATNLVELLEKIENEALNGDEKIEAVESAGYGSILSEGTKTASDLGGEKEVKLIEAVAKMHGIDISDIQDILPKVEEKHNGPTIAVSSRALYSSTLQPKRLDMSVIANKCIKKLTRERNSSIAWPSKKRKGSEGSDTFSEVPLMS